jgi:hypothetical protein
MWDNANSDGDFRQSRSYNDRVMMSQTFPSTKKFAELRGYKFPRLRGPAETVYAKVAAPGNGSLVDANITPTSWSIRQTDTHAGIKRQDESYPCHGLPLKQARTSGYVVVA